MQCTSYNPGCYSSGDLNVGVNGGAWPLFYNNERNLNSGSYSVFLPPTIKDPFAVHSKDILRQTMLKHESIFRNQVHELHRLYRRQKELMDETKRREPSKQHIKLQTCQSAPFLPKIASESSEKTWQNPSLPWVKSPAGGTLPLSSTASLHPASSLSEWKNTLAGPYTAQIEGNLNDSKLLGPNSGKPKRKMLDLELPAEEYIDSEDEDQSGDANISKVHKVPCYSPKGLPQVSRSEVKPLPHGGWVNSIYQNGSSGPNPFPWRTNFAADLNEPVWLNNAVASDPVNFLGSANLQKGISCKDSREIVSSIHAGKEFGSLLRSLHPEDRQLELLPHNHEAGQGISNSKSLPQACFKFQSIEHAKTYLASPLLSEGNFNCGKNMRSSVGIQSSPYPGSAGVCSHSDSRIEAVDLNMPPSCLLDSELSDRNGGTDNGVKKLEDSQAILPGFKDMLAPGNTSNEERISLLQVNASVDIITDRKLCRVGNQIDLNSSVPEDESSSVISKTVAEIDLEAPISPENKECSPPRGESEENQLETDELEKMAAEAIVFMSMSCLQNGIIENTVCETLDNSPNASLLWFARTITSMAGEFEDEVGAVSENCCDQQELSSDGSDYFEAMTVQLTETKVEEYWCTSNGPEKEELDAIISPSQPRRGPARRGRQRKDFQTELLPSLASLSRHEVTEDLQMIGGLMEAAGFLVQKGLGRRNAGRCLRTRKKRSSNSSSCNGMETNTMCNESASPERSLKGWGKINRRPRRPRIPASNPPNLLS